MKNFLKNKVSTVLIIIVTLILAGVAIFTALRLYQLRQQPVAPNVPASTPSAAELKKGPVACTALKFSLGPATTPIPLSCNATCNVQDASMKCSQGLSCTNVSTNPNTITLKCRDPLCPTETNCVCPPTVLKCNATCNVQDASMKCGQGLSCTNVSTNPNTAIFKCRNSQCSSQTDCACPTVLPTATPTATPGPTATPNSCGGTCGSNINCATGYYCNTDVGFCRKPSCPDQADCNCPGTTSTPGTSRPGATSTAPALPSSGTDWPTFVGAAAGIFVIIGSLLLAL